jgi:5-methyltetrahydrofolate--homocysteine methyltransferase
MGEFEVTFPRQKTAPFRCLTDYVGEDQKVGLFAVTAGPYHDILETLFHQGRYQDCVIYHAVTVQLAEAGAEYIHHQMREGAGLERRPHLTQKEIEATIYTGKRFSFGYGACPDMSQQSLFAHCLPLDRIGVTLTPTWMLDPEASVTAMVFLDERCEYYFV